VSGATPEETCEKVNALLTEFAVVHWNFAVIDNRVVLTALLLSLTELRKQQIAQAGMRH
jgi:hypothetical protein